MKQQKSVRILKKIRAERASGSSSASGHWVAGISGMRDQGSTIWSGGTYQSGDVRLPAPHQAGGAGGSAQEGT